MSLPADIAEYLEAHAYGVYAHATTPTLNSIFLDEWQDAPSNQIIVIMNGGKAPLEELGGTAVDFPGVDIQVRNTSKATARELAEEIRQLLDGNTIGDCTLFNDVSAAIYLGKDDSNRHKFVITFSGTIERI